MRYLYCLQLLLSAALLGGYGSFITPRLGPAAAAGRLVEVGDALSGLPNNAAWQGVANDGTFFYVLTSQNTSSDLPNGKENIIRKYRISDGELVATKNDAYPDTRRFSSGEVIDNKLYIVVRDANVFSTWAHIAVYDTTTLRLIVDHDIAASAGYAVPEGVAWNDGYFWVVFGGYGRGTEANVNLSAVVKYDSTWAEVAAYELFTLPWGAYFGAQDIFWITDSEIVTNMHEGKPPEKETFDRWAWTGDGFTKVAGYEQLDDDTTRLMGQGFTELDGYLYFAGRYSDRIVKAELALPTPVLPSGDSDGDGCTDAQEAGPKESAGGRRDPLSFWDFYDVYTSLPPLRDRAITVGDIGAVVARFGAFVEPPPTEELALTQALTLPPPAPAYHAAFDRGGPLPGQNLWNLQPPDGSINIVDIGAVVAQFGHRCNEVPVGFLQVHHINVGQGDGAVIISPGGEVAMVDNGRWTNCAKTVAYLQGLNITTIDFHFASHYHADHIGCLDDLAAAGITVGTACYDRGGTFGSATFDDYAATCGALRQTLSVGQVITLDAGAPVPVTITVVALDGAGVGTSDENGLSLALLLSYGTFGEILAGDLTGTSPDDVESVVGPLVGDVEVLKVNHHGSRFSSNDNWLDATSPEVAIISVGSNSFGHPTEEALGRLHSHGVQTYWTNVGSGATPVPESDRVGGTIVLEARPNVGGTFTVSGTGFTDTYVSQ